MSNPLVSVIIPTFNRAHLISGALASVINQTYKNLEIIVVDDASTDNTEEVIKGINDERISYIKHQTNKGGGAARNTGIKAAQGEYIAFLDSDDEWLPEKIEKQISLFSNSGPMIGVVSCKSQIFNPGESSYKILYKPLYRGNIYDLLRNGNSGPSTPTAVVKKEFIQYFDEELPAFQEVDLWLRISQNCQFEFLDEVLVTINMSISSITRNIDSQISACKIFLEKHGKIITKKYKGKFYFDLARHYSLESKNFSKAKIYFIKAAFNYFNVKYIRYAIASQLGHKLYNKTLVMWKK